MSDMKLEELAPDMALKALLDGKVKAGAKAIKVYAQGEQPNVGAEAEYITVLNNGVITSLTQPMGLLNGNLALSIHSRLNSNHTIKRPLMRRLTGRCVELVDRKSSDGLFFRLDPNNVITPPTPNNTTGYATTTLNVAWHTT